MYSSLMTGAIGIKDFSLEESIALAADTGFEGVWFDIRSAKATADEHGVAHLRSSSRLAEFDRAAGARPCVGRMTPTAMPTSRR